MSLNKLPIDRETMPLVFEQTPKPRVIWMFLIVPVAGATDVTSTANYSSRTNIPVYYPLSIGAVL